MDRQFVAVQVVWVQVSADYQAQSNTRTLVLRPETTIAELMAWAKQPKCLGLGDVVVSEEDAP